MSENQSRQRRRVHPGWIVALIAVALLLFVWRHSRQQRRLIHDIQRAGGGYLTAPRGSAWLLGDRFARTLGADADLEYVFLDSTEVDDAWLAKLENRDSIRQILLQNTKVTDAGLGSLSGLQNLERLRLDNTSVTDDGLKHLQGLQRLRRLYLKGTKVSEAGVERLQNDLPNCRIIH